MGRAGERRGGNWDVVVIGPRDAGARLSSEGQGTGWRRLLHAVVPGRVVAGGHGWALPIQPLGQLEPVPVLFPNGK